MSSVWVREYYKGSRKKFEDKFGVDKSAANLFQNKTGCFKKYSDYSIKVFKYV